MIGMIQIFKLKAFSFLILTLPYVESREKNLIATFSFGKF
jgi:hypothetical protein